MIARGDKSARDAFRAALLSDTPIPLPPASTEELDAIDILEVHELAEAIARAESSRRLPACEPEPDIFDALAAHQAKATPRPPKSARALDPSVPTDDASGPALHATPETLELAEEDAYYHPGGRIRTLADVTFEPESTLLLRLRARRTRASRLFAALIIPLTVLAIGTILSMAGEAAVRNAEPAVAPAPTNAAHGTSAAPKPSAPKPAASAASAALPSFDVKSLPAARRR